MAVEVTDVLERFLTHEFVILVDGIILVAQGLGLYLFVQGVYLWLALMRTRTSSPMVSQMYGSPPSPKLIMAVFIASAFMWKFGEGIAAWGSLFWHGSGLDFSTPYSAAMFDDISQRATNLVNVSTVGTGMQTRSIAIRACFAVMSIYGVISYFRGVMGITLLANPQMSGQIKFSHIVVHMGFGIFLVYIDFFYQSLSNTITAATMN
ncbi:hypothetical protein P3719_18675 [Vibrio parahaemolyticus]|uniref:Uncharacterized protein n=1 Tax=Vibrio diabolicus TaxID=50719 RepID=A0AA92LUU6_9VIBR|nr:MULTISPECIES: hypothetical protein [Vibrio]EJG1066173.1 hypothetical protein [Vibrio parahaemolyticus O1]MDW1807496.1 hypothetical protein [Vibrio sp. Vb2362]MDW2296346.1 hypothetical protein [Vibrio sp. 1404]OOH98802.1 hypothetical protein BIW16_18495 [Vibrio sp. OULL4]APX09862.1 hypothetical protein BWP24_26990 [Vibrio campbellii]